MSAHSELRDRMIGNFQQVTLLQVGHLALRSSVVSCPGFSAQLIDEENTETMAPALSDAVTVEILGRRPRVWTDLLGRKQIVDALPGSFFHIPAGLASWWHNMNCGGPMLHMTFDPPTLRSWVEEEGLDHELPPSVGWKDRQLSALTAMLRQEMEATRSSRLYVQSLAVAVGVTLLRRQAEARRPARGGLSPFRLRQAMQHIQARLAEDLSLNELAAAAGLSPFHFLRSFKQETGSTPYAWLTARRVERAQELMLAHPAMPLMDVALAVGYASQTTFGAAFRRAVGASPGEWRRSRR
jgi:AraC family transcriptional regulator